MLALGGRGWSACMRMSPPARWQQHSPACATRTRASSSSSSEAAEDSPRAALMCIGDEILSGSIADTNTPFLAKLLHSRGVDLIRCEFIPDQRDEIIQTAQRLRQLVGPRGFVFSSGGIGPTHDDVTYEALAHAFGATLELHQPTVEIMKVSYGKRGMDLNEARLRMATLPTPAEVLVTPGTWVPLVNLGGVYILPGIPKLFQQLITAHQERFTGRAFVSGQLFSVPGESFIADQLTAVSKAHPKVSVGSYPNTDAKTEAHWKVRLAFSSRDQTALDAAVAATREAIPHLLTAAP
mmetsp:Transcript_19004/g.32507  ORF Transcript_19004/g.32507 Transcript_19004/m.32507 type:complete len:295 (+) Transcript_19004:2-886(+)